MVPLCRGARRAGASATMPTSGSVAAVAHEESPSAAEVSKREGESGELVLERRASWAGLFSILAWLGRKGEGRGTHTSSTHVFLRPGGVSSSAGRLVPLVVVVVREEERLFFRGDEPPVRGMTETLPSLGILGDGRDGLAFASSGARAARCFAGEPCMVVVLMAGVQEA